MNTELYKTRDMLVARRDAYSAAISCINELIALEETQVLPSAPSAPTKRLKAPNGALPDAILSLLVKTSPLNNVQTRAALKEANYPYSITPEGVRVAYGILRTEGKVRAEGEGTATKYFLKKK